MRIFIAAVILGLAGCSGGGGAGEARDNVAAAPAETAEPAPAATNAAEPETKAEAEGPLVALPDFDTERHCRAIGGSRPNAAEIAAECRREEAEAREALARRSAPEAHRTHCEDVAGIAGGSYAIYAACLDAAAAAPLDSEAENAAQAKQ